MADPLVVTVVLNWNNYDDTATCLDSIIDLSYGNQTVLVVDNGSTDGSGERIDAEYPDVEVLFNGGNLGFAGGMNRGVEAALDRDAAYVWLLNNDLTVRDVEALDALVSRLRVDSSLGVVSPLIRYPDSGDVWFWRGRIDWDRGAVYHPKPPASFDAALLATDYVPICCALFPTDVFEEVGTLDERYFLYYEDADFAARLDAAGYDLATDTTVEAYHEQGGSSGDKLGPLYSYYNARNPFLFGCRFADRVGQSRVAYLAFWLLKEAGHRMVTAYPRGLVGLLRGVLDGVRGVEGRGPYP